MKKIIITTLLLIFTFNASAQREDRRKRIKVLKIAFITERLNLTETEAQQFWPIYNAFEDANDKLRHKMHENRKGLDFESISEQEAKLMLDDIIATEKLKNTLRETFLTDLQKILPSKKIILLKITEDAFNRRLLEEMKKRREQFRKNKP
jgi:hypothetical protein